MTLGQLQQLLMWCSVVNIGLMTLVFLVILAFRDRIRRIHSRLFQIPEESVTTAVYYFLGTWKLLVFVFFVIPWLSLYWVN